MEYARIELRPTTADRAVGDWSWIDEAPIAQIPLYFVKTLERSKNPLSFQFEVLDIDIFRGRATIVRTDTAIPYYAYYRFERDVKAIVQSLKGLGSRVVRAAERLGLAYVPPGEIVSWHHLGKSRPPKKELTVDINVSLPDGYAEAMRQVQEHLAEAFRAETVIVESLSERINLVMLESFARIDRARVIHVTRVPIGEVVEASTDATIATIPIACDGCTHYHGAVYNGTPFICAIHPYGADGDECNDFER